MVAFPVTLGAFLVASLGVTILLRAVSASFCSPARETFSIYFPTVGKFVVAECLGSPVPGARFRTSCAMQGLVRTAGSLPRQAA